MLTGEEDMEISALAKQGWTVSAIARHLGRDRKTVRAYLSEKRSAGVRIRVGEDSFDRLEPYLRQRLVDDPHLWATVLFSEAEELGYDQSYPTFVRKLRDRGLRPHCEPCVGVKGRATVDIEHPPGIETQWDWLELSETPWGEKAYVLVGALSHSGKFRAFFSERDDQGHLIVALDEVSRRLGGVSREWRFDRMATVINPTTGQVQASFVTVAKHFGVKVLACPPRRGNRKGVVEKAIHYLTQRWWRTASISSLSEAQQSVDRFCEQTADRRLRQAEESTPTEAAPVTARLESGSGGSARAERVSVAVAAAGEPLLPLPPMPYPVEVELVRRVAPNGLVSVWGNHYSVPPALIGGELVVRWRHGTETIDLVSAAGTIVCSHRLSPRGANRTTRLPEHTAALENVVLASFTTARPCQTKLNRPPSDLALALAAELVGEAGRDPVIDLARYQKLIDGEDGA